MVLRRIITLLFNLCINFINFIWRCIVNFFRTLFSIKFFYVYIYLTFCSPIMDNVLICSYLRNNYVYINVIDFNNFYFNIILITMLLKLYKRSFVSKLNYTYIITIYKKNYMLRCRFNTLFSHFITNLFTRLQSLFKNILINKYIYIFKILWQKNFSLLWQPLFKRYSYFGYYRIMSNKWLNYAKSIKKF